MVPQRQTIVNSATVAELSLKQKKKYGWTGSAVTAVGDRATGVG